jgi:hypothetical protein
MAHREVEAAEPLVLTLHHSAAYLGKRFGGVLLGSSGRKAGRRISSGASDGSATACTPGTSG